VNLEGGEDVVILSIDDYSSWKPGAADLVAVNLARLISGVNPQRKNGQLLGIDIRAECPPEVFMTILTSL
jgi:hypothetical protein